MNSTEMPDVGRDQILSSPPGSTGQDLTTESMEPEVDWGGGNPSPESVASRLVVLTGDGKGKTSSASGMLLRALGHGQRAVLVRFLKARPSGEVAVLARVGVEILGGGKGFLPSERESRAFGRHAEAAQAAWDEARDVLTSIEGPALVVLDEICTAVSRGVLESESLRPTLGTPKPGVSVVCTGRGAPDWLCDLADTVSEVVCRKHGYQIGIPATKGVEL